MANAPKFPFRTDNSITKEFAKYAGKPNATRNKRTEVKKANPFHYTFGNIRPVWKTYLTYAQNMELLHGGMYEDEDNQVISEAEPA